MNSRLLASHVRYSNQCATLNKPKTSGAPVRKALGLPRFTGLIVHRKPALGYSFFVP
jgi:hypothetical protein